MVAGKLFGQTFNGKWDGTRLSFTLPFPHESYLNAFEGWLVKETRRDKIRCTLTGVRRFGSVFAASMIYGPRTGRRGEERKKSEILVVFLTPFSLY